MTVFVNCKTKIISIRNHLKYGRSVVQFCSELCIRDEQSLPLRPGTDKEQFSSKNDFPNRSTPTILNSFEEDQTRTHLKLHN